MKYVGEEGIRVGELAERARTPTNLAGMLRWGYVTMAADPADTRAKVPERDQILRATAGGRAARETWKPLFAEIERRWETRFGAKEMQELRGALRAVVEELPSDLPDCMPILGYGLVNSRDKLSAAPKATVDTMREPIGQLHLVALVARVLLAFALEFEERSHGSLAIGANVLRVLAPQGVAARDVPVLSGVSKESIAMAMGILKKFGVAEETREGATKMVRLTAKGTELQARFDKLVRTMESEWREKFGVKAMARLREALEAIVRAEGMEADANGNASLLFAGISAARGELACCTKNAEDVAAFSDGVASRWLP